ncbi:MAG: hypothetical protein M1838_000296 [Thelocarpon superellum]|nr:MAG: hypothetical protein M1838_000296 [Thelocarpon superellum]
MSSASSSAAAAVAAAAAATAPLPLDIILETLLSVVLFCLGLVLGSPALQPLRWRVWAGKIEREGGTEDVVGASGPVPVVNPFASLEARVGFWDVRAKRREFDEWVREKGAQVPS